MKETKNDSGISSCTKTKYPGLQMRALAIKPIQFYSTFQCIDNIYIEKVAAQFQLTSNRITHCAYIL